MKVALRCTVRGCAESLEPQAGRWSCARGHSFDLHRSGFLNLLQPQARRSKTPGDSRDTALARRRLIAAGHLVGLHRAVIEVIKARTLKGPLSVLDVGCGEGGFVRELSGFGNAEAHGVDISAPSIELAAKTSPGAFFVVANADRFLPYADQSFDFIVSIDARVDATEFDRVLSDEGLVLIAVPSLDDLVELRERIHGAKIEKRRVERVEEDLGPRFTLEDKTTVREQRELQPSDLRDLLTTTYRGFRRSEQARVSELQAMTVTLSHEVLVYAKR